MALFSIIPWPFPAETCITDATTGSKVVTRRWSAPAPGSPTKDSVENVPQQVHTCSALLLSSLVLPEEMEMGQHKLESSGCSELLAWVWELGGGGATTSDARLGASLLQMHEAWEGEGIREPLRASPICMAGEVLLLQLSKGVLVTPYCL